MLDDATEHCRNNLRANLEILKTIVQIVESALTEGTYDVQISTELVYLTYHLSIGKLEALSLGDSRRRVVTNPRLSICTNMRGKSLA